MRSSLAWPSGVELSSRKYARMAAMASLPNAFDTMTFLIGTAREVVRTFPPSATHCLTMGSEAVAATSVKPAVTMNGIESW